MSPGATSGRSGRPRSTAADDAILRATIEVVVEHGIHDASVDEIAARAHAGKDTIYRRWPHKEDLIRAALEQALDASLPVPDSGSLSADLTSYLESLDGLLATGPSATLLRELVAEAAHDPTAAGRLATFRQRHVSVLATIMARSGDGPTSGRPSQLPALLVDWACGRRLMRINAQDARADGAIEGPDGAPAGMVAWLIDAGWPDREHGHS